MKTITVDTLPLSFKLLHEIENALLSRKSGARVVIVRNESQQQNSA